MTHNDFDHLAQLLPEKRSPCAVGSNILHSVFIQPGFVVAISILQFFFFFQLHPLSIATLQLHSKVITQLWLKVSKSTFSSKPFLMAYSWKTSKQLWYANIYGHGASIFRQFLNALLNIIREFISANNMAKGKRKILEDSLTERISSWTIRIVLEFFFYLKWGWTLSSLKFYIL